MQNLMHYLDLFGVAVFAVTGSLAAGRKRMTFWVSSSWRRLRPWEEVLSAI